MGATWSPDGTRIAFLRFAEDFSSRALFVVGADGTGEHFVTDGARVPAWQPRGARG
jgi:Tol biopolymer transport system component